VVGKAEHLEKGANPRLVVTSLPPEQAEAKSLYEDVYGARGDMENRIKEQQLCLFADRTSSTAMRANELRLWFSSVGYVLMTALQRLGLQGTELAPAQCDTIRLKLLKIGARMRRTTRSPGAPVPDAARVAAAPGRRVRATHWHRRVVPRETNLAHRGRGPGAWNVPVPSIELAG
jgi:hypothetical protein